MNEETTFVQRLRDGATKEVSKKMASIYVRKVDAEGRPKWRQVAKMPRVNIVIPTKGGDE